MTIVESDEIDGLLVLLIAVYILFAINHNKKTPRPRLPRQTAVGGIC